LKIKIERNEKKFKMKNEKKMKKNEKK